MLKKWIILLCCLLISGCTSKQEKPVDQTTRPESQEQKKDLVYKKLFFGDGNDMGFYHIVMNEISERGGYNILYYDYSTKKEIYLCDKPQCSHEDKTCTSYLETTGTTLFLNGNHLYLLTTENAVFMGENPETLSPSALYYMDLDGKNRKKLCDLPSGYSYSDNRLTLDAHYLYLPLQKSENIQIQENSYMQSVTDAAIFCVDLKNGETLRFKDNKDQNIIAVQDRFLIFSQYNYEQDPQQLLNEQRFEEYDHVMKYAQLSYYAYDLDKKEVIWVLPSPASQLFTYYNNHFYYIEGYHLHAVNVENEEDHIVVSLPESHHYDITEIQDGYIMISAWEKDENRYVTSYCWNINESQLKEMTLKTSEPIQEVTIYSEYKDYYFVYYDHQQHMEKTWAGTDQYTMDKMYVGLIKKNDFWNNIGTYETFDTISLGFMIRR